MKVMVVGSGGREHALTWKLCQSKKVDRVYLASGNDGLALEPKVVLSGINASDYSGIVNFSQDNKVDLVVIGPDQALSDGLTDRLMEKKIPTFGPTKEAARLESSKIFAKKLMTENGIPTAEHQSFDSFAPAKQFVESSAWSGWAIKADGLALGKGVILAKNKNDAVSALSDLMINKTMGEAGSSVVIEELLLGREVSAFYLCDRNTYKKLGYACDYKQLRNGGNGPNTGGMGAYCPAEWLPRDFEKRVETEVVEPLLKAMMSKSPFSGVLFIGLMCTDQNPKVIEFNVRFGDPEAQAIMPLIDGDIVPWLEAVAHGKLNEMKGSIALKPGFSVHVVKAAYGYPGTEGIPVRKGDIISIDPSLLPPNVDTDAEKLFFAGVKKQKSNFFTNGGRVLGLTALADTKESARNLAYEKIRSVSFADEQVRTDVAE